MAKKNKRNAEETETPTTVENEAATENAAANQPEGDQPEGNGQPSMTDHVTHVTETVIKPIIAKNEGNILATAKALEAAARDYSGEKNKARRVAMIAQFLGVEKDRIAETKATTTALATIFTNVFQNLDPGDNVREVVLKKEHDTTPSELENALATRFSVGMIASERVKSLNREDLNTVQSAVHAGFQTAMAFLDTKENRFPRAAADLISFLIAASNGSTTWFECNDAYIAEVSRMSTKTIQRGREKLVDWMKATGKGVVAIKQETGKPTMYKINLLDSVSAIIHNMLSADRSTDNLLVVAGLSGKLLTESTDKLRSEVSDADLAAARNLNSDLAAAVETLPAPDLVVSDSAAGRKQDATKKKFESLRDDIGTAIEQADEQGLPDVVQRLQELAQEVRTAGDEYDAKGGEVNFEPFENVLSAKRIQINDKAREAITAAEAKAEEEKEATGTVSPETRRNLAKVNVDGWTTEEERDDNIADLVEEVTFDFYILAEATERQGSEAKTAMFLQVQEMLNAAFGVGQHKVAK